jgi:Phosphopantetheine attachment site
MNETEEGLQHYLIAKAAQILQIDPSEVMWEADIDEFGFGSMEVNRLCVEINAHFSVRVVPVVFLECTSLQALSAHLLERFAAEIDARLLTAA